MSEALSNCYGWSVFLLSHWLACKRIRVQGLRFTLCSWLLVLKVDARGGSELDQGCVMFCLTGVVYHKGCKMLEFAVLYGMINKEHPGQKPNNRFLMVEQSLEGGWTTEHVKILLFLRIHYSAVRLYCVRFAG